MAGAGSSLGRYAEEKSPGFRAHVLTHGPGQVLSALPPLRGEKIPYVRAVVEEAMRPMGNSSDTGPGTCRCPIVGLLELVFQTRPGKMGSVSRAKQGLKCQDLHGLSPPLTSLPVLSALLEQPETDERPWFHVLRKAFGSLWWPPYHSRTSPAWV